jgi:hypothetical protein
MIVSFRYGEGAAASITPAAGARALLQERTGTCGTMTRMVGNCHDGIRGRSASLDRVLPAGFIVPALEDSLLARALSVVQQDHSALGKSVAKEGHQSVAPTRRETRRSVADHQGKGTW